MENHAKNVHQKFVQTAFKFWGIQYSLELADTVGAKKLLIGGVCLLESFSIVV